MYDEERSSRTYDKNAIHTHIWHNYDRHTEHTFYAQPVGTVGTVGRDRWKGPTLVCIVFFSPRHRTYIVMISGDACMPPAPPTPPPAPPAPPAIPAIAAISPELSASRSGQDPPPPRFIPRVIPPPRPRVFLDARAPPPDVPDENENDCGGCSMPAVDDAPEPVAYCGK